mmetsp:Transcript_23189/g.35891  ORF Transcript_23189/g.35891 Transcript_23189/m.35891 type:complete len:125 (-) Transcript_23189:508-882(-)
MELLFCYFELILKMTLEVAQCVLLLIFLASFMWETNIEIRDAHWLLRLLRLLVALFLKHLLVGQVRLNILVEVRQLAFLLVFEVVIWPVVENSFIHDDLRLELLQLFLVLVFAFRIIVFLVHFQ